jgi:signal transduction histidine kinase
LDGPAGELQVLRRQVRDLAALLALPALWRGLPASFIAASLVDVLRNVLRADLVAVRLGSPAAEAALEAHWPPAGEGAPPPPEAWLAPGVREAPDAWTAEDPGGRGPLRLQRVHAEGLVTGGGVVLVGARREGFPTEQERYLLQAAVGQAVISVNDAELLERERQARRESQEAVRLRDEFLSVAAHELRTPLTSLKLQHELVARTLPPEALGRVAGRLAGAQRQVSRLSELVESLLDVSRIAQGRLTVEPEELDLAPLVGEAVGRLREVFQQAGCAVEVHAPGPVVGRWDPHRLDQVLVNLLTNAAKYGAGRPIHVALEAQAGPEGGAEGPAEGEVRLTVRDQGIGIDEDARPRLFGKFERAVSERHYGGLGLGLFISRQIVEAHGGRITLESAPGQGATFTVHLPRVTPPASTLPASTLPASTLPASTLPAGAGPQGAEASGGGSSGARSALPPQTMTPTRSSGPGT